MTIEHLRDRADAKVIACAVSAKADCIVTGDKNLLALKKYKRIEILKVKTFLENFRDMQIS